MEVSCRNSPHDADPPNLFQRAILSRRGPWGDVAQSSIPGECALSGLKSGDGFDLGPAASQEAVHNRGIREGLGPSPLAGLLRAPDHGRIEPDRQRTPLAQGGIAGGPVRRAVAGRRRLRHTPELTVRMHIVNPFHRFAQQSLVDYRTHHGRATPPGASTASEPGRIISASLAHHCTR